MITIVGGTYREVCFEPIWKQKFGSGLRACHVINALSPEEEIHFHTFTDSKTYTYLQLISFLELHPVTIDQTIEFYYDHPLATPHFFPRLDTIKKEHNKLAVESDNILFYGMIEGNGVVKGKRVVYDPQSPAKPIPFSQTGSQAQELVYVINFGEARRMSGQTELNDVIKFFFDKEMAAALVLKMGPLGARIITRDSKVIDVPVYKTNYVWAIGSGDVFAATFAHHWFTTGDIGKAAQEASWMTACYCNSKAFIKSEIGSNPNIVPLLIKEFPIRQIYLAGPFFTFAQRWLVNEIWTALIGMKLKVFSPWHDVGHGDAEDVVPEDVNALNTSGIVFAILDGLDSGTLFEVGYAVKQGIDVIGFVQNETAGSLKMLEGTNCVLENDLTTAIYKCFWKLAENE
jgi:nucleoside 2-deoxyribosyltransferase